MKKSQLSAVMRELNARRNKKYGKEWRKELAKKAAMARWSKKCPSCLAGFSKEDVKSNCTCRA